MLIRGLASVGRWDGSTFINREGAHFSGDAIADLRTQKNTLSVWYMNSSVEENDAIVAMCLNRSSLDKFVYVTIEEEEFDKASITYERALGKSDDVSKKEILEQHRDLTNLDYDQLGIIAHIIHEKVSSKQSRTLSKKKVAELVVNAIAANKVQYNNKNAVIVESYDLLKKEKPVSDYVPIEDILKKKEEKINNLELTVQQLRENNKECADRIHELEIIENKILKSNRFECLKFLLSSLFRNRGSEKSRVSVRNLGHNQFGG